MKIDPLAFPSAPAYYLAVLRAAPLYRIADRVLTVSRRFLFIGRLFRILSAVMSFIEASAVLLLAAGLFLGVLPILIAGFLLLAGLDRIRRRTWMKRIRPMLARRKIVVFFHPGRVSRALAEELAADHDTAVFLVDSDPRSGFVSARTEGDVILLRDTFFYYLKRTRFDRRPAAMIYLF